MAFARPEDVSGLGHVKIFVFSSCVGELEPSYICKFVNKKNEFATALFAYCTSVTEKQGS